MFAAKEGISMTKIPKEKKTQHNHKGAEPAYQKKFLVIASRYIPIFKQTKGYKEIKSTDNLSPASPDHKAQSTSFLE